jgi:hypothetical protein
LVNLTLKVGLTREALLGKLSTEIVFASGGIEAPVKEYTLHPLMNIARNTISSR